MYKSYKQKKQALHESLTIVDSARVFVLYIKINVSLILSVFDTNIVHLKEQIFMISITNETGKSKRSDEYVALRLLIERILTGSLVIMFIGVCSFAVLFITMCLL